MGQKVSGGYLDSSSSTGNIESMQVTASTNCGSTYVRVYGYSGSTNTYTIEITTDNPGGGQSGSSLKSPSSTRPMPRCPSG